MNPAIKIARAVLLLLLLIAAPIARAQDLGSYLKQHVSFVGGIAIMDASKEKLVEIRLSDSFDFAPKWHGGYRLGLFSIARAGDTQPVAGTIPVNVEQLQAYSDGEAWGYVYRDLNSVFSIEGLGGLTFKMASVAGPKVDPLDGTKLAAMVGIRIAKGGYAIAFDGGHYGPVVEQEKVAGFLPSVIIHGRLPLGSKSAFVPDIAFGRGKDGTLTRSYRLGIEMGF